MLNVIVDLSHHNHKPDLQAAADAGILGVIHKATQGTGFVDPTLIENCAKAKAAQLFWGAYHFGVAGDGAAQANRFLEVVQPEKDTLLALDFEQNHVDDSMTLDQARAFIARVRETTGQFPGLYGGSYLRQLLARGKDDLLASCWLWLAQYGATPNVPPNWPFWTMWQYTDGAHGDEPHGVPGIGRCDRDKFNGDLDELKRLWGRPDRNPQQP